MHGRPRQAPSAATPEEVAKIQQYNKHKTAALVAYKNRIFTPTTLALTSSILSLNPDLNTLYNYRKEQVIDLIFKKESSLSAIFKTELQLSTTSLKKNPKSYHAWYHRIWCLEHGKGAVDIQGELALTEKLLGLDARNFHCWNYRRYLARTLMGLPSPYSQSNKSPAEIQNEKDVVWSIAQKYQPKAATVPPTADNTTTTVPTSEESTQSTQSTIIDSLDHIITQPITVGTVSIENELLFTQKWIENDFSNYSAWHYRSLLLPTVIMRKFIELPLTQAEFKNETTFESFFGLKRSKLSKASLSTLEKITSLSTMINAAIEQLGNLAMLDYQTQLISLVSFSTLLFEYFVAIIIFYIEFDLSYINIAITMSPNDQSPWLYQRWVLSLVQQLLNGFKKAHKFDFAQTQQQQQPQTSSCTEEEEEATTTTTTTNQLDNSITDFISTTFVPDSDHNLHYIDLVFNNYHASQSSPQSSSPPQSSSHSHSPKLIEMLLQGLQVIIVQSATENAGTDVENNTVFGFNNLPSPQTFFAAITNAVKTPLTSSTPYTIDTVIQSSQKMTISTVLAATATLLEQAMGSPAVLTIKPALLTNLQTLQIKLLTHQYLFLTQELLPLIVGQVDSQRQVLLGVVILRLCIGSVFLTHRQLAPLATLISQPSPHQLEELYQGYKVRLSTLKSHLAKPITDDGHNEADHAVNIIKVLISIDSDREGYYREIGELLKRVNVSLE